MEKKRIDKENLGFKIGDTEINQDAMIGFAILFAATCIGYKCGLNKGFNKGYSKGRDEVVDKIVRNSLNR